MFLKMFKRSAYSLIKDDSADGFINGVKLTKYNVTSYFHPAPAAAKNNASAQLRSPSAATRNADAPIGPAAPAAECAEEPLESTMLSRRHPERGHSISSVDTGFISGQPSIENEALAQALEHLLDQCGPVTRDTELPESPRRVSDSRRREPSHEEVEKNPNGEGHRAEAVASGGAVQRQSAAGSETPAEDATDLTAAKPEREAREDAQPTSSCLSGQTLCCVKDCAHNANAPPRADTVAAVALRDSDDELFSPEPGASRRREEAPAVLLGGVSTASRRRFFFGDVPVPDNGHRGGKARSKVRAGSGRRCGTTGSGDGLGQLQPGFLPEDEEEEVFFEPESRRSIAEAARPPISCRGNLSKVEAGQSSSDERRARGEVADSQQDRAVKPARQASTRRVSGLDHLDQLCCLMEKIGHQKEVNQKLQKKNQELQTELQAQKLQQEAFRSVCTCGAAAWPTKAWGLALPGLSSPAHRSVHSTATAARSRINSEAAGLPARDALGGPHRRIGSLREERARLKRTLTLRSDKHG